MENKKSEIKNPKSGVLTEGSKAKIRQLRDEFPDPRSAVLPALYLAQADHGGWVPVEAIDEVADLMGLTSTFVGSVASFYTLIHTAPVGRHKVYVCTNISCSLLGGEHILKYIGGKLGVLPGGTTADGQFSLFEVECLGSCGTAPMMQIDDTYYENLTEEKVDEILAGLS
ncbi:MAG TPA: NADH-quinone oxidoreductase subunit NuoE [Anaerolineae bacterium]|nr:NADH-quinone oxidoreductase subunit NuoE [Anaerolineae bacterium]